MGVHCNDSLVLIRGEIITIQGVRYVVYYALVQSLHHLASTCEIRVLLDFDPNIPLHPPYTLARVRGQLVPGGNGTSASPLIIDASTGGLEKYDTLVGPLDPLFFISGIVRDPRELGIECIGNCKWLVVEVDRYDGQPSYVALLMEGKFDTVCEQYTPGTTIVAPARFAAKFARPSGLTIVAFEPVSIQNISSGSDSRPYTWKGLFGGAGATYLETSSQLVPNSQDTMLEKQQDDLDVAHDAIPPLAAAETIVATPSDAYGTAFSHSSSTLSSDRGSFSSTSQPDDSLFPSLTTPHNDSGSLSNLHETAAFTSGPENTPYLNDSSDFVENQATLPSSFGPAVPTAWPEPDTPSSIQASHYSCPVSADSSSENEATSYAAPVMSMAFPEPPLRSVSLLPSDPQGGEEHRGDGAASAGTSLHGSSSSKVVGQGQSASSHTRRIEKKVGSGRGRRGNSAIIYSSYEQYQHQMSPPPPPPPPQQPCNVLRDLPTFPSPSYCQHQPPPIAQQHDSLEAICNEQQGTSQPPYSAYQPQYWGQEGGDVRADDPGLYPDATGTQDIPQSQDISQSSSVISSRWITLKAKPSSVDQMMGSKREHASAFESGHSDELPRSRSRYL